MRGKSTGKAITTSEAIRQLTDLLETKGASRQLVDKARSLRSRLINGKVRRASL